MNHIGYEKSKKWARKNYSKIKEVACPVLQGELIRFSAVGFDHLVRKLNMRSHKEQKFRFSLIPYASRIVADPHVQLTHRSNLMPDGTIIKFWGLEKACGDKKLRVVIRQKENGPKHFYSIMECSTKNPA